MFRGVRSHIVLLDNFLETGIVQLNILGQVVDIGDNVTQVLLEKQKIAVTGGNNRASTTGIRRLMLRPIQARDDIRDLLLTCLYPAHDLLALHLLEGEDLVQFALE